MKILVTGGAGYIGSVLVPRLLVAGHSVHVLDNLMYGQSSLAVSCTDPQFEFTRGDARDLGLLFSLSKNADAVIPLAALVGAPLCERRVDDATTTNYHAVESLAASLSKDQLIVYPNTTSGYGSTDGEPVAEDSPMVPISHYGRTKCMAEGAVRGYRARWVVLRLATVFGASPRMRTDLLVNDFVLRAATDRYLTLFEPDYVRGFVHVHDAVSAFIAAVNVLLGHCSVEGPFTKMTTGEVYNIGAFDLTKRQLCEGIRGQLPDFMYHVDEVGEDLDKRNYRVDYSKAARAGWKARYGLREGVAELIKLYQMRLPYAWGNV